jgi:hypothetical protein
MELVFDIVRGTPLWVWAVLALIIHLGMTAMRPGTRSPVGLSLVPATVLTVAIGILFTSARLPEILPLWLAAFPCGAVIGAAWATLLPIRIDRSAGTIEMSGTSFWLVTGLVLFGLRYAVEVYLSFNRGLADEPVWTAVPYAVSGLGTGMSTGWWAALMGRFRAAGR